MRIVDNPHGVTLLREGYAPVHLLVLAEDPKHGLWVLVGTDHQAVEVRVTPKGRRVSSALSRLTARTVLGDPHEHPARPR